MVNDDRILIVDDDDNIVIDDVTVGTKINFICPTNHVIEGMNSTVCGEDGNFNLDGDQPTCVEQKRGISLIIKTWAKVNKVNIVYCL